MNLEKKVTKPIPEIFPSAKRQEEPKGTYNIFRRSWDDYLKKIKAYRESKIEKR